MDLIRWKGVVLINESERIYLNLWIAGYEKNINVIDEKNGQKNS